MIVKNESHVIKRCLESVRPYIDHWIIVDTGSTDGTQEVIRSYFKDVPGTLHEREWKDFAHNRSEALSLARNCADYSMIIDADDYMTPLPSSGMPELIEDCYMFNIVDVGLRYPRIQLVSNKLEWFYRGVLHEFITSKEKHNIAHLPWEMIRNHDGARRNDPTTYVKDAQIFLKALEFEDDKFLRTRYTFYLAQSFRDCKQYNDAIKYYQMRSEMGGWQEEVFYSLYQIGKIKEHLGLPDDEILAAYEMATNSYPSRVEAIHAASRYCRIKKKYKQGYEIAIRGLGKTYQNGSLFGEPFVYQVGLLDEFAVNAYWTENYLHCIQSCLQILKTELMRGNDLKRIISNIEYSVKMLSPKIDSN
jgi:glycosyltransferase involved in cell wall biosynthesis